MQEELAEYDSVGIPKSLRDQHHLLKEKHDAIYNNHTATLQKIHELEYEAQEFQMQNIKIDSQNKDNSKLYDQHLKDLMQRVKNLEHTMSHWSSQILQVESSNNTLIASTVTERD
mmetsp:Transcript_19541/g.43214  ORF Transcript_19541/g.43214 Transcript_19541/m.43214 type:complete len:115 (+) Transcript_19541:93-437(+)